MTTSTSTATASFTRNISEPTIDYLNSLPFNTWDCFPTMQRNLDVTHHADIERPKHRIFIEFKSGDEIQFTVNNDGVVRRFLHGRVNVWTPYADELQRLLMLHDVHHPSKPTYDEVQAAAYNAKVANLESMEYADLLKLYKSTPGAPQRKGLKKDRASLVRRLAKRI